MSEPTPRRNVDEIADGLDDPYMRGAVRIGHHLRRYQPFYVFGILWILMAALFPSVNPLNDGRDRGGGYENVSAGDFSNDGFSNDGFSDDGFSGEGSGATSSGSFSGSGSSRSSAQNANTPGSTRTSTGSGGAGSGGLSPSAAAGGTTGGPSAGGGSGTTVAGHECKPGVRQIPWSLYAAPCRPASDGANPGATARGVSGTEIVIVERTYPASANSRAVDATLVQAGFADPEIADKVRDDWWGWFNQVYDLYGRQVKHVKYESQNGDSTAEAQSKGKEGACLDADVVAKEIGAFAAGGRRVSGPFGECAAERELVAFQAGAYFPESWYRRHHPFLYETLMECERISLQLSEYVGKRLAGKPARWALDPVYQQQERVFGTYVPDNDEYQHCVSLYQAELKNTYGTDPGPKYDYILDVSRFADEAAKAVVQFKAQGVTSLILACDPISIIFLTQAAESQQWGPEWVLIGVAAQDTDNFGRLYSQNRVVGHMFGLSQLGDITTLIGPTSESGESYRAIPPDQRTYEDMPEGTNGGYYDVLHTFNGLQLAGPTVNAQTIFEGYCGRYGAAKALPAGLWRFDRNPDGSEGCDHAAVDDSREVYWDGSATAPDGKKGTFVATMDGKRFTNGEWPQGDPQVYPGA